MVTISLMVLLTVVVIGLLSLSAVTMRSTGNQLAVAEARANARMAMMLAIGELQKQLGPDQRVTASGAIVSSGTVRHPHWTGVWDSWHAGAATSSTADEPSEHQTIAGAANSGMHPTYQPQRKDHFRSWLVSLDTDETNDVSMAQGLELNGSTMPDKDASSVKLVADGSLGSSTEQDHVSARLIGVQAAQTAKAGRASTGALGGRYAWWVGDQSQKARIMNDSYQTSGTSLTMAQKVFRHQAPASTGTSTVKGLETLKDDQQLKDLPSLGTLDLVGGVTGKPSKNFHDVTTFSSQILTDVRAGGLKRDLTTLLERPIDTNETKDDFMLYRFDTAGQERVPIQDLAAFYQLYDSSRDPNKTKGIRYSSSPQNNLLVNGIQVAAPDYGDGDTVTNQQKYLREYTSLYRSPVPIKVQLLVGMKADPIPAASQKGGNTHRLLLGFLPAVTLWNPNNVPITMNMGDPNHDSQMLRFPNLSFAIEWHLSSSSYTSNPVSLAYAASAFSNAATGQAGASNKNEFIFDMYFSATQAHPVVFEPGEVRLFSYSGFNGNFSMDLSGNQHFIPTEEAQAGWDPTVSFLPGQNSSWSSDANDQNFYKPGKGFLAFKSDDIITFVIKTEKECGLPYPLQHAALGAAMNFVMAQKSYAVQNPPHVTKWGWNNYDFHCRTGNATNTLDFSDSLIRKGYPKVPITTSIKGADLIAMLGNQNAADQWQAFLQFALMAGCETNENGTSFSGRKFASRPFLHSSPLAPAYIDDDANSSLYNYGWNWWVKDINSILEAKVENDPNNTRDGLYGGGYTLANGTSHVVQQEIPVTPPISIAELSHAHLGGFSLSGEDPTIPPSGAAPYQRVTAIGYGGLFPHTLQAIGNSYAHPNLAADKAFTNWTRTFVTGSPQAVILADHSYLANKALWDEYFFSSLAPAPAGLQIFGGGAGRTAEAVADDFFFQDTPTPLPNRRLLAYTDNFDKTQLSELFQKAQTFNGGLADQIAAHLMVDGAFNVNSTSVEAWKVFLSSLKGKPVAYLDKSKALTAGVNLSDATPTGTPVGPSSLPNGKPFTGSSSAPSDSAQWTDWRELTDTEIEQLATAIVKQVKLRGPFLSLSEFVNRRLDATNKNLSVMGALQAAIDDDACTINAGFRNSARQFSTTELSGMNAAFPEALNGPVAYGSAAYVDQADILRNFAEQLTPRGDTFVIRSYGDALDAKGNVTARAWCEAVVQRVPDYVDPSDASYLKPGALTQNANKVFGRKLRLMSFRFLGRAEI